MSKALYEGRRRGGPPVQQGLPREPTAFAFAKIVGIELSPDLHRIAEDNISRYNPASQQCMAFELHCMDVVDYEYGPEPVVLFLFDPFGRDTLPERHRQSGSVTARKASQGSRCLRLSAVRGCVAEFPTSFER